MASTNYDIQIVIDAQNKAQKQLESVSREMKNIKGQMGGMKTATAGATQSLNNMGSALAGLGIGVAMKSFASSTLELAGNLEQARISFTTMLGSAEKADSLLRELSDFAANTPFELTGIRQNAKQLLAMGIAQEKLLPTLKSLGDVSAGLSVPLDRLALAYGQVIAKGKLQGGELKQFTEAGVPILEELSRMVGASTATIQEMVSKGQISSEMMVQAFQNMSSEGGKFADLMDAQSNTYQGALSNMQDSMNLLQENLGSIFIPMLTKVVSAISPIIESIGERMAENPNLTATITAIVGVLGALVVVMSSLGFILPIVTAGATALGTAFTFLATNPIGLTITAIVALTAAGVALYKNRDIVASSASRAWGAIKNATINAINAIIGYVNKGIQSVNVFLDKIGLAIPQIREVGREAEKVAGKQSAIGKKVGDSLKSFGNKLKFTKQDIVDFGKKGQTVLTTMQNNVKGATKQTSGLNVQMKKLGSSGGGAGGIKKVNTEVEKQQDLMRENKEIAKLNMAFYKKQNDERLRQIELQAKAFSQVQDAGQKAFDGIGDAMVKSLDKVGDFDNKIASVKGKLRDLGKNTGASVADEFVNVSGEIENVKNKLEESGNVIKDLQSKMKLEEDEEVKAKTGLKISEEQLEQVRLLAEQKKLEEELALAKANTSEEEIKRAQMIAEESGVEKILREAEEKKAILQTELETLKSQKQQEADVFKALTMKKIEFENQYLGALQLSTQKQAKQYDILISKAQQYNAARSGSYVPTTGTQAVSTTDNSFSVNLGGVSATIREEADIGKVAKALARNIDLSRKNIR